MKDDELSNQFSHLLLVKRKSMRPHATKERIYYFYRMCSEYKFVKLHACIYTETVIGRKEGKGKEGEKREKAGSKEVTEAGKGKKKQRKMRKREMFWRGTSLNPCLVRIPPKES